MEHDRVRDSHFHLHNYVGIHSRRVFNFLGYGFESKAAKETKATRQIYEEQASPSLDLAGNILLSAIFGGCIQSSG